VRFDIGATTYYQRLNALLEREAALAYDPVLVGRLRARRGRQQRTRSARRAATGTGESDTSA
jgi:hypothetical protein